MTEHGARVGARPFCKMIEMRRGRVGQEPWRGSIMGLRAARGSVARARVGDSSRLDRGRTGVSRAGRSHGTKARASGTCGSCLARSVG
jgi:hypothetical protein